MKKVEIYQCDLCGTLFYKEEDCKNCENSHEKMAPDEEIQLVYENNSPYPK